MKGYSLSLLLGALVLGAAVLPQTAQAQSFCLIDNFGFEWDITLSASNDMLTGAVDVGGTVPIWDIAGARGTNGATIRHHALAALNPTRGDDPGCDNGAGQTDWFVYNGRVSPIGGGNYSYNGAWANSCAGGGTFTGTITPGACPAPRVTGTPSADSPAAAPVRANEASAVTTREGYALASHPNPAANASAITYTIPEHADVRVAVYDALGRQVAVLVDEAREAGTHTVTFDAASLPAGTYVYQIVAGAYTEAQRLVLTH